MFNIGHEFLFHVNFPFRELNFSCQAACHDELKENQLDMMYGGKQLIEKSRTLYSEKYVDT